MDHHHLYICFSVIDYFVYQPYLGLHEVHPANMQETPMHLVMPHLQAISNQY